MIHHATTLCAIHQSFVYRPKTHLTIFIVIDCYIKINYPHEPIFNQMRAQNSYQRSYETATRVLRTFWPQID